MLPNDTEVILSICIAVVDCTCIKSVREFRKFVRLKLKFLIDLFIYGDLKAGVGYIKQNNLQFHHFLHCTQAVNIYRS